MNQNEYKNNIWEQLILFSAKFPLEWSTYQNIYDIKKLELQKLSGVEINQLRHNFEKKYKSEQNTTKSWMENEYRLFIWFVFVYSKILVLAPEQFSPIEWNVVSSCFCRNPLFCQYFYLSSKKLKLTQWRTQQDIFVQKMMNSPIKRKWTQIGLQLFIYSEGTIFRKPKSIRERWLSHLNPQIKKNDWTAEQDLQLIRFAKEKGKKWSKISKIFGNRSEHTVKNRYNQLISKFIKQYKQDTEGSGSLTEKQVTKKIEAQLLSEAKSNQIKSIATLPQPLTSITKIEEQIKSPQLINLKLFEPIIVSMNTISY